jgi:hypothetical protein
VLVSGAEIMVMLHCQTSDGAAFLATPGSKPTQGFHELGKYQFSVERTAPCRLLIDEVELSSIAVGQANSWDWQPGYYAGTVLAELIDAEGMRIAEYMLDVSPDPNKLGQQMFQEMVDDLFDFAPGLLMGSESAQLWIGVEGEVTDPNLEYARLRRYGKQLLLALKALGSKPLSHLTYDRTLFAAHQVRRLDQRSLISLVKNPSALAMLCGDGILNEENTLLFDAPHSRDELDTPAHRTLFSIVHSVIRRTRSVMDALTEIVHKEEPSSTRTALASRLDYRLQFLSALDSDLRRYMRCSPFTKVTRKEVSAAGLNTISAHPQYAKVYRMCWHILRPGIAGERGDESVWMSPTWEIYERWCFLKIRQMIEHAFPTLAWQPYYPSSREDCIQYTAKDDRVTIKLYLQPRFPAFDRPPWHSFSSLSGERYPDIVVTYSSASIRRLFIFDAKYRTTRSGVLDAMQSAHLYHDCLRWEGIAPEISLLLVPAGGGAPWLEKHDFVEKHSIGVVPLHRLTDHNHILRNMKLNLKD